MPTLGRIGIWSMELRFGDSVQIAEAAAELEELGFGALWVPGGIGGDITGDLDRLLAATRRIAVASGIINVWKHTPAEIAGWWKALPADRQSRVMLGLGISHGPAIGDIWKRPISVMREYLDRLDAEGLPRDSMCLAALGPRMVELARNRTAGAHPYLVTPEHSARSRAILGSGKLLAPEQGVILETDPARARDLARQALTRYGPLPNYVNSWRRLGFSQGDVAGLSDRLLDGLFAWGGMDKISERVNAHLSAGADHVCLQVISDGGSDFAGRRRAWRKLSEALLKA